MKPEAGEWPIPMRFSRDRAGSRQATGPKQLLTLRQPGSHPFAPSFRWDPSPRRKCESPQGLRAFYSQPVGWLALGTELPGSRETDRGGVGFPTPCVQPMVGPLALSFSGQCVPNGISERCFLLINS